MAANLKSAFSGELKQAATVAGYNPNDTNALTTASKLILVVLSLVGIIFLVLTIYGGILWMTAGGKEEQVKKAGNIITRAVIGLVIVVLAYAITYFIIKLFP